ncbi:hypothetical protein BDV41DRAFT_540248 [Aspergillus transmontanensis]|uniref:Uncharacterized protein n=1 Tax=Aspergillus transmontanensis TaxID=1034304 RepID=A0A5N6VU64_9EURO|nr:hypothetical protein BDV41DRAFT_540248 [Aspergillus transmontanensis]
MSLASVVTANLVLPTGGTCGDLARNRRQYLHQWRYCSGIDRLLLRVSLRYIIRLRDPEWTLMVLYIRTQSARYRLIRIRHFCCTPLSFTLGHDCCRLYYVIDVLRSGDALLSYFLRGQNKIGCWGL